MNILKNLPDNPRPGAILLTLIALTALSLLVAERLSPASVMIVALFGVAMVKGYLVMVYFMEVNHAARHWRRLYIGWVFLVSALLILGHIFG